MDTIRVKELEALVKRVNDLAQELGILEGGEWIEGYPTHFTNDYSKYPQIELEHGSVTYGRAWRLVGTGGSKYRTAHYDPFHLGSGYLGASKREAYSALRALETGLSARTNAEADGYEASRFGRD